MPGSVHRVRVCSQVRVHALPRPAFRAASTRISRKRVVPFLMPTLRTHNASRPLSPPTPSPHTQLLFLSGISLILGFQRTKNLFLKPEKLRGTGLFFAGILLVVFRWPKIGFFVEVLLSPTAY